jgi:putative CocE/NonD family hydrolase
MRDGVRLFTAVYVPKNRSRAWPILMNRTPYSVGPYGVDAYPKRLGVPPQLFKSGYIFVFQDVRGRFQSEGEFVDVRPYVTSKRGPNDVDEASDAYDTIDFLVKHVQGHNGKVGVWGISYPGFYAAMAAIDAHPALKAVSPQAPVTDWFIGDDFHHNGALFLPHAFNFYSRFGQPRPAPTRKWPEEFDYATTDGYDFFMRLGPLGNADAKYFNGKIAFWEDLLHHPNYDDWWKARNIRPHLKDVRPAMMTVGGWFDAEDLFGALETYRAIERQHPRGDNTLVMGPWPHGGWARAEGESLGDIHFGQKTSKFYQERIEAPFFDAHLKGNGASGLPEAWSFESGTNEWRSWAEWPPSATKRATLFFKPSGKLGTLAPEGAADDADAYVSDPQKPVPYRERQTVRMAAEYMLEDQRFAARRPDVLVYATDPLTEEVALAGPLEAELWVSTTGTDADFVVKLIDVFPDDYPDPDPNPAGQRMAGYQMLVRGEPMRGRFRNGFDRAEPFRPGEPTLVRFTLPDVSHAFRASHRIMVQVQSTWFPLVDRNPQTFVDVYSAKESDFHPATHKVFRAKGRASSLSVRVLRGDLALPR